MSPHDVCMTAPKSTPGGTWRGGGWLQWPGVFGAGGCAPHAVAFPPPLWCDPCDLPP